MRVLADTHLLIWGAEDTGGLSQEVRRLIVDPAVTLLFSVVSIWELAIKSAKRPGQFDPSPPVLRRSLLDNGWQELPVIGEHALAVAALPPIHRDPFDRLLVAQATVEDALLLTSDRMVARYPGPVRLV